MPEHLEEEAAQDTEEFQHYLRSFRQRHEQSHRRAVVKEAFASLSLMIAG